MTTAVQVEGLAKRYGDTVAVADVAFEVDEGEIVGLLGPNGSGKTTTVECLQGLRRADAGRLRVFGHDPGHEPRVVRRLIGSQLQDSALPERLKVWEALRLFATIDGGGADWEPQLHAWGWPTAATPRSATCRAGSASGCSSRSRCWPGRGWSCSTR